jgi:uncharacterized protein (DUF779 family)
MSYADEIASAIDESAPVPQPVHEVKQGSQDVVAALKKGGWVHVNVAGHTYELAKNKMGHSVSVRKGKGGAFGKSKQYTSIEDALGAIDLGDQTSSSIIRSGTF